MSHESDRGTQFHGEQAHDGGGPARYHHLVSLQVHLITSLSISAQADGSTHLGSRQATLDLLISKIQMQQQLGPAAGVIPGEQTCRDSNSQAEQATAKQSSQDGNGDGKILQHALTASSAHSSYGTNSLIAVNQNAIPPQIELAPPQQSGLDGWWGGGSDQPQESIHRLVGQQNQYDAHDRSRKQMKAVLLAKQLRPRLVQVPHHDIIGLQSSGADVMCPAACVSKVAFHRQVCGRRLYRRLYAVQARPSWRRCGHHAKHVRRSRHQKGRATSQALLTGLELVHSRTLDTTRSNVSGEIAKNIPLSRLMDSNHRNR